MFLAYIDDSGNTGVPGSITYTLGCVIAGGGMWNAALDGLVAFRRDLKNSYGIPVTAELKANYIIRNKGMLFRLGLNEQERHAVYQECMRVQPALGLKAFAVVIHKERLEKRKPGTDPREVAWEFLLQRLGATSDRLKRPVMIVHDHGDSATVRKIARKARRAGTAGSHFGTGQLKRPTRYLIEDPVPRDSRTSLFIQLADMNAYAAFRRIVAPPPRLVPIVPQTMWDELGRARYAWVNKLVGGQPGIVVYPRQ